jgi:hypothetical protein
MPNRCVTFRPKRVFLHMTEDRAPPFISSGNQRLRYYRQAYPSLVCSIILYSAVLEPLFSLCNFVFRPALFNLCPWSSRVAGLGFVFIIVQPHHRCVFVSAAIPSTITQIPSRYIPLLDLPLLAALCELSPRQP